MPVSGRSFIQVAALFVETNGPYYGLPGRIAGNGPLDAAAIGGRMNIVGYLCNRCGRISLDPGGNCGHMDDAVPLCRASERDEAVRVLMCLADEFSGMPIATDLSILTRDNAR